MDDLEVRTMHVFISRALQKVLKEAPKKQTQLREACKTVIGAPYFFCARPFFRRTLGRPWLFFAGGLSRGSRSGCARR